MEVKQYDILLKRAKVEAMKIELEKLSPEKTIQSGNSDLRVKDEQADRARRRDMLKIVVPDFKRGDADEVLNSITNFNTVLRACGLEAVAIWTRTDRRRRRLTWAPWSSAWCPKTSRSWRRCAPNSASEVVEAAR